jgi:hypothetical protein
MTSYLSTKLLSIHNVNNWELYNLEKLSIYPVVGQAIRRGVPFEPARPTTNDLFPGTALRMYSFLSTDLTSLDPPSLLDFCSAVKTFDKLERLSRDEEAKVYHLLICSFSEEAKMLLLSVPAFVTAFNDNDSFAICIVSPKRATHAQAASPSRRAPSTNSSLSKRQEPTPSSNIAAPSPLSFDRLRVPLHEGQVVLRRPERYFSEVWRSPSDHENVRPEQAEN